MVVKNFVTVDTHVEKNYVAAKGRDDLQIT